MHDHILETPRLIIRNWRDSDRDIFYQLNSDPQVMAFFPSRRSRVEADAFMDKVRQRIDETGYGFYALELKDTQQVIGLAGLAQTDLEPFIKYQTIEIGWRLLPLYWRYGYVTEAARALLDYGFNTQNLPEIVSFAVSNNLRSLAVMQRIGMQPCPNGDFDHPNVPDSHPHLKPHSLYYITQEMWSERTLIKADSNQTQCTGSIGDH